MRRAPHVDIVLGPQTYHRLPEMVAQVTRARDVKSNGTNRRGQGVLDIEFPADPKFDFLPDVSVEGPSAFLSVQEGCDKFARSALCLIHGVRNIPGMSSMFLQKRGIW